MARPLLSREDEDFMSQARKDFAADRAAWSSVREQAAIDIRMTSGKPGSQWDQDISAQRVGEGVPTLEFNELSGFVCQYVNGIRQQRPTPKVEPGDDQATDQTAEMLEGHIRHIEYASQADVAFDTAAEQSATGGFGFYEITVEYASKVPGPGFWNQEPRIKRILDPMTVTFDGNCKEPDFSDARRCWQRERIPRSEFRRRFGVDPIDFDGGDTEMIGWSEQDDVWIAKYWHVDVTKRRVVALKSGAEGFADELEFSDEEVEQEREEEFREVKCDLVDGARRLDPTTDWVGEWIPVIPVLGREVIVDGQRQLISLVRFARDPQKLLNATGSSLAENLGTATRTPLVGWKGQFRDLKWKNPNKRWAYMELDPAVGPDGQLLPPPDRHGVEPAIAALSQGWLQMQDAVKRSVGYSDNVVQPSQQQLSGVAVMRRTDAQTLTNFHLGDNLTRSQWHCGRILVDLILNLTDTPRALRTRTVDGKTGVSPVTMQLSDGRVPEVRGHEGKLHHRIDMGRYNVAVTTGPSYASKRDEERDVLLSTLQQNPQQWPLYADLVFEKLGYPDLAERAKMLLPPQLQQAGAMGPDVPPQVRAQLVGLQQQNAQLKQGLQQVIQLLKSKQLEVQGKIDVEKIKTAREITVAAQDHAHDHGSHMLDANLQMIQRLTEMLHETEMAPDPTAQPAAAGGKR